MTWREYQEWKVFRPFVRRKFQAQSMMSMACPYNFNISFFVGAGVAADISGQVTGLKT